MAKVTLQFEGITSLQQIKHAALFAEYVGFPLGALVDTSTSGLAGARFQVTTELRILPDPDVDEPEVED